MIVALAAGKAPRHDARHVSRSLDGHVIVARRLSNRRARRGGPPTPTQDKTNPGRRCRVLVLEDDTGDLFLLERALRTAASSAGVAVELIRSENGLEGLSSVALGDLTLRLPDVVIVDLNMPIMGGELFLRRLRVDLELRQVPAVVLTTSNQKHDHATARALGANDVFSKPSSFAELVVIAGRILDLAMKEAAPKEAQRIAGRRR